MTSFPDPPPGAEWTLTARWLMPVDRPPLRSGTLTLQGDRIIAVDPHGTRKADLDLGNVAILPGFVNPHTHLDLSDALGKFPPSADFPAWLQKVVEHRLGQSPAAVDRAIALGIEQCLRFGTTLVGDISAQGASWPRLGQAPLRSVVFRELIGLSKERATQALADAKAWLTDHPDSPTCRSALSPHAPYSVRWSLFDAIGNLLDCNPGRRKLVAVHFAETRAEMELLQARRGPLAEFLRQRGAWDPDGLAPSHRHILDCLGKRPNLTPLWIHANYFDAAPQQRIHGSIIYCPRTHAAFEHPPHPFAAYLAQGGRVALATDSLASNPDLDMLAEARWVHGRHPSIPGEVLLRMITLDAAAALDWADVAGSLTPGKSADLVVLPLPDEEEDPHALILESAASLTGVLYRGAWRL